MKICPPPPRSSAIGPLGTTSYAERSVTCLHCQKVHDRGFIWKFSDEVRVCFTCYRVMGEDGRKGYERKAAKSKSKQPEPRPTAEFQAKESPTATSKETRFKGGGSAMKVIALLALFIIILGAGACFLYKPLTGETPEHGLWARVNRMPANR